MAQRKLEVAFVLGRHDPASGSPMQIMVGIGVQVLCHYPGVYVTGLPPVGPWRQHEAMAEVCVGIQVGSL